MGTRDWLGLTVGALLAGVGLGAWLGAGDPPAPAPEPVAAITPATTVAAVEVVVEEVAPEELVAGRVNGLPPAVARVLEANGNLGLLGEEEAPIPESVRRVLIAHDAVLTVEEPAAP